MAIHLMYETHVRFMINGCLGLKQVPEDEVWREDVVKMCCHCGVIEKIPSEMSPRCPNLTVLNLEGTFLSKLPELFFIHMEALTVLNLSGTDIESLPSSVSNLENLRTLKLAYCKKLTEVPSLAKLVKLKVLDLWGALVCVEGHMGIEKLKLLENSNIMWNDWAYFNSLLESWPFSSLHKYRFVLHNGVRDIQVWGEFRIDVLQHDRAMLLISKVCNEDIQLPHDIQVLLIYVLHITSLGDAFSSAGVANMLKTVGLSHCKGMEYVLSSEQHACSVFSQVSTLKVSDIDDLGEIIKLAEEFESPQILAVFPCLRHLYIRVCPKLRSLVSSNSALQSLECFSNLETLSLHRCVELPDLTFESSSEDVRVANTCNVVVPNLRDLRLEWLPKLEGTVCRGLLYTSLHQLTILGCHQVKEVFSLNLSQHSQSLVPSLKKIQISYCSNLEVIFSPSNNIGNPILVFPSLTDLTLGSLPKLCSIYRGLLLCTSIQRIYIKNCPNYERIRVQGVSKAVICDTSTLASLPLCDEPNKDWWAPLEAFPEDAHHLSDLAEEFQRSQQSQGPNSRPVNLQEMSSPPLEDLTDHADPMLDLGMGVISFGHGFSNAAPAEPELNLFNQGTATEIVGQRSENLGLGLNIPSAMPSTQVVPFFNQWLTDYCASNEASSSGHGNESGRHHQQFDH